MAYVDGRSVSSSKSYYILSFARWMFIEVQVQALFGQLRPNGFCYRCCFNWRENCYKNLDNTNKFSNSFFVIYSSYEFAAYFTVVRKVRLLNADVSEDADNPFSDTDPCVENSVGDHAIVLLWQVVSEENKT